MIWEKMAIGNVLLKMFHLHKTLFYISEYIIIWYFNGISLNLCKSFRRINLASLRPKSRIIIFFTWPQVARVDNFSNVMKYYQDDKFVRNFHTRKDGNKCHTCRRTKKIIIMPKTFNKEDRRTTVSFHQQKLTPYLIVRNII